MINQLIQSLQKHANNEAFRIEEKSYSYAELASLVKGIQQQILSKGPIARIGIYASNSIETYASILATWLSGAAYIPLHPKVPDDRNLEIIENSGAQLILTNNSKAGFLSATSVPSIETTGIASLSGELRWMNASDEQMLYILFTSGSTGKPKGVPISLKNIQSFLTSYDNLGFSINASDRYLQMFDLTFDVSVASYLVPLLHGATVCTVSSEGVKYFQVLKVLQKERINFASIVPSVITYLRKYFGEISLPELKYCILTAEASNKEVVLEWMKCIPNATVVNLYGPTEATIWCTGYTLDADQPKSYNDMLVIGAPFSEVKALILDNNLNPLPIGEKGELCISSDQLSQGYLNDPDKTKAVFIEYNGTRFYKTGDLCYLDESGCIVYCGRIDYQVKIQGFRIELNEIEFVCKSETGATNVAVTYKNAVGVSEIALFVQSEDMDEVKKRLANKLPYYMIPARFYSIQEWPVNNSGKIDRIKLIELVKNEQ